MDCIFCKIGAKEIPAHMTYEDEHAFAILDIHPVAPGHTMVIPKLHAANLLELPPQEVGPVFEAVQAVTARLQEVLRPDGFTIGINHGDVSGQTVKHLHIHVLPRFMNDGGKSIHAVVHNPGNEDTAALAKRLRL